MPDFFFFAFFIPPLLDLLARLPPPGLDLLPPSYLLFPLGICWITSSSLSSQFALLLVTSSGFGLKHSCAFQQLPDSQSFFYHNWFRRGPPEDLGGRVSKVEKDDLATIEPGPHYRLFRSYR